MQRPNNGYVLTYAHTLTPAAAIALARSTLPMSHPLCYTAYVRTHTPTQEQDVSTFILALTDIAYALYEATGLELPVLLELANSMI